MATVSQQYDAELDPASGQLRLPFVSDSSDDSDWGTAHPGLKDPLGDGISRLEFLDQLGDDITVVNAARVSYGKELKEVVPKDRDLLKFLAEHAHTSPFRHAQLQFRVKAPIFVLRQWQKHLIGAEYAFKDTAWNEISGRYIEFDDEFYAPKEQDWRLDAAGIGNRERCGALYIEAMSLAYDTYERLIKQGVAKEQARLVLPLSMYSEFIWTASLQAVAHFCALRRSPHAQAEIRKYGEAMHELAVAAFPESYT